MNNEELNQIVSEINQMSVDIENINLLVRENGRRSLELAIKTGGLLYKCKDLLKEADEKIGWETWFDANVKGFTFRMGQYYTKLFKYQTKHVSFFDDCESIREALRKIETVEAEEKLRDIQTENQKGERKERTSTRSKNERKEITATRFKIQHSEEYHQLKKFQTQLFQNQLRQIFDENKDHFKWGVDNWGVDENGKLTMPFSPIMGKIVPLFETGLHSKLTEEDAMDKMLKVLVYELFLKILTENNPKVSWKYPTREEREALDKEWKTFEKKLNEILCPPLENEETGTTDGTDTEITVTE